MTEPAPAECPVCGNEIDPDICHCGITKDHHKREEHPFIPMGCDCGRAKPADDAKEADDEQ